MKYWQLKLKGKRSVEQIEAAVGKSGANLLRIHVERGETHVYFAADKPAVALATKAARATGHPKEVTAEDVVKIG